MPTDVDETAMPAVARPHFRRATRLLGKKWHPLVLSVLLADDEQGFSDIKTDLDGVSDKVLSDCLADLEDDGLVTREVIDDRPVRVEYGLTEAGRELESIFLDLQTWSERHLADNSH